ncbi:MAG: FecR domain-containing protein [Gammaproteobacteria bacterium]
MGHETGTSERLLAEAARWHARLAAEDCTDFDRVQFQRWRAASRRHAEAYESAAIFSQRLERLAGLDETLRSMADEAFAMGAGDEPQTHAGPRPFRSRRAQRWMVPAALAASVVAALIGVQLSGYFAKGAPPLSYASSDQSRRDVTLADGSLVHLDVDSEINVSFSGAHRDITLVNGRALFEVSHDASRPFVVTAGQSHTTALGTHFQVQRESQQVLVTLTEGSIAVTGEPSQSKWSERLSPGEQISLSADGRVHEKRAVDSQAVTSWSRGRLVFRGTPLAEALQEVNRYGRRKVRLGDPDLADLPVDGNFIAGETDLIVSAFAAALPLRVAEGDVGEVILFRRYKADVP